MLPTWWTDPVWAGLVAAVWDGIGWVVAMATSLGLRGLHFITSVDGDNWRRLIGIILAIAAGLYAFRKAATSDLIRRYGTPIRVAASVLLVIVGVLVSLWSDGVQSRLGAFVTSPGLAATAATIGAFVALYGVSRQVRAQQDAQIEQAKQHRSEQFWITYRWCVELVNEADSLERRQVALTATAGLIDQAHMPIERQATTSLTKLLQARLDEDDRRQEAAAAQAGEPAPDGSEGHRSDAPA